MSEEKFEARNKVLESRKILLQDAMQARFPGFLLTSDLENKRKGKLMLVIRERELQAIDLFLIMSFVKSDMQTETLDISYNFLDEDWLSEFKMLCSNCMSDRVFHFHSRKVPIELEGHSNGCLATLRTYIDEVMAEEFPGSTETQPSEYLIAGQRLKLNIDSFFFSMSYRKLLIFSFIQMHPEIKELDLSDSHIDDRWIAFFKHIPVSILNLAGNAIVGKGIEALAVNPHLISLDLRRNGTGTVYRFIWQTAAEALVQNNRLQRLLIEDSFFLRKKNSSQLSFFMTFHPLNNNKFKQVFPMFIAKEEEKTVFDCLDLCKKNKTLRKSHLITTPEIVRQITKFPKDLVNILWEYLSNDPTPELSLTEKAERLRELHETDDKTMDKAWKRYHILTQNLRCICQAIYENEKNLFSSPPPSFNDLAAIFRHVAVSKCSSDPWVRAWDLYSRALELHPADFSSRKAFIVEEITKPSLIIRLSLQFLTKKASAKNADQNSKIQDLIDQMLNDTNSQTKGSTESTTEKAACSSQYTESKDP